MNWLAASADEAAAAVPRAGGRLVANPWDIPVGIPSALHAIEVPVVRDRQVGSSGEPPTSTHDLSGSC
jgi:hypothetical protein